jgi:hypothetical protein
MMRSRLKCSGPALLPANNALEWEAYAAVAGGSANTE